MKSQVVWSKRMSFEGSAETGFSLPLGASAVVGGDNDGFRPMELILIGLAGCTAMDVISILNKTKQNVTDFEVKIEAERADTHPKVFTKIDLEYLIGGVDLNPKAVDTAIKLSKEKYCPAQAMLGQVVPINITVTMDNK